MSATVSPSIQLVRVTLRQQREGRRFIVIDDLENIRVAVASGVPLHSVWVQEGTQLDPLQQRWLEGKAPRFTLTREEARQLFGELAERESRIFALARRPRPAKLVDLRGDAGDILLLDGVTLAGNLGAVIRTAEALYVSGIVVIHSEFRDVFERRLIRASRGLVFRLPVVLSDAEAALAFLQAEGLPLVVTDSADGAPVQSLALHRERLALAFGSEKWGYSPEVQQAARLPIHIPMKPSVESLNLSVAASITLFCRQHRNQACL